MSLDIKDNKSETRSSVQSTKTAISKSALHRWHFNARGSWSFRKLLRVHSRSHSRFDENAWQRYNITDGHSSYGSALFDQHHSLNLHFAFAGLNLTLFNYLQFCVIVATDL
ncbi:PREDICTED: uncharacterized protein LOC105456206 [Wasmannia auropunctata]|uniref:uncharacterized protein LOC105456206 n=1 Tax=Wasmannia auropunctata TaxID=64793 RepID=UPI0005EDE681|nr:PREDICTED: uncharacterized protein LOC105456206 [Wasmannia auropunctata]